MDRRYIRVTIEGAVSGDATGLIGYEGLSGKWLWDGIELTAQSDRFGFQPLYYRQDYGGISISPSIERLIAQGRPALDYGSLGVFLRLGFFIGDDTPFETIKAVPPASILNWKAGMLRITSTDPHPPIAYRGSRQDVIEMYVQLFRDSITTLSRQYESRQQTVLLSGGRDSRHILIELHRLGVPVNAVTVALPHTNDAEIAAEFAGRIGVQHTIIPVNRPSLRDEQEKNRITGFCSDEHAWLMPLRKTLDADVLYDGIAGDVLSQSKLLTQERLNHFRNGELVPLAHELLSEREASLMRVLNPEIASRMSFEQAQERLTRELARHADWPNPVSMFYFFNRTRREIALAPFRLLGHFWTVAPYLHAPLFDFLTSLPAGMILDRTLHDEVISRAGGCEVPYESKNRSVPTFWYMRLAAEVAAEMLRRNELLNRPYVLLRLVRCSFDPGYAPAARWIAPLAIYLNQLGLEH